MQQLKLTFLALLFPIIIFAQTDSVSVQSPKGITGKMLEIISGDIGEERDWDRFRSLFLSTAQLVFKNSKAPIGKQVKSMSIEEFIERIGPLYKRDGLEEYSIGLTVNEFNGVATVFQSFYCKNLVGTYEERGVNSYQLIYADDRWWIVSSTFANETEDLKIPAIYLDEKKESDDDSKH